MIHNQKNHRCGVVFVAGPRIELGTSWLWIMRSNQLSYPAKLIRKGGIPESGLITSFSQKRVQKYCFFLIYANFWALFWFFLLNSCIYANLIVLLQRNCVSARLCVHRTRLQTINCIAREILCNQNKVLWLRIIGIRSRLLDKTRVCWRNGKIYYRGKPRIEAIRGW